MATHMTDIDAESDNRTSFVFGFSFDPLFRVASAPFGVTPSRARVEIDDDRFVASFGPWRVETPLSNIVSAEVTGPYALPKVLGPAHLSLSDRGLTFATNNRQGVCIRFAEPVSGLLPLRVVRHPGLTVTVDEPAALAALLDRASREDRNAADEGTLTAEELSQEANDDLQSLTAAELRQRGRDLGIKGVSKMKKAELVEALTVD
jgi:hypothetical protein